MRMELVSLQSEVTVLSGFAWKSSQFKKEPCGMPIIRIQNVGSGSAVGFVYWKDEFNDRFVIKSGELLLTLSGSFRLAEWEGEDALLNQRILKLTPSPNLDRRFFLHYMQTQLEKIERMGKHALVNNVSVADIKNLQIPLPPLAEQKRIAAILDAADTLRAKRRVTLTQLDTLLQSTFLDMFGDPVTNPKRWEMVEFHQIGNSRLGKMLDRGKESGEVKFPYLANFNVQWGMVDLEKLRSMEFTEKDRKEFQLEVGDLLICEGGDVGRTAIWQGQRENVYFQKALHRVRLNRKMAVPDYVHHYMWFMSKNGGFRDFTNSATIAHLTGVKLKRLPFPLPPLDLQHRFATIVESIEQQKTCLRAHLAELDTLFAALQSRAFNGEL